MNYNVHQDTPQKNAAYEMGNQAYFNGWTENKNPFNLFDEELNYIDWNDGYNHAKQERS